MTIAIILIAIYLLSALFTWNWIRIAYSKEGVWSIIDPENRDIAMEEKDFGILMN